MRTRALLLILAAGLCPAFVTAVCDDAAGDSAADLDGEYWYEIADPNRGFLISSGEYVQLVCDDDAMVELEQSADFREYVFEINEYLEYLGESEFRFLRPKAAFDKVSFTLDRCRYKEGDYLYEGDCRPTTFLYSIKGEVLTVKEGDAGNETIYRRGKSGQRCYSPEDDYYGYY